MLCTQAGIPADESLAEHEKNKHQAKKVKKHLLALISGITAAVLLVPQSVSAEVLILPHERQYLEDELTRYYSDASLAERVGICAVILNRIGEAGYPDTAAGAIESLRVTGEFSSPYSGKPTEESLRLSHDAVAMALSGADPTGGALNFTKTEKKLRGFGSPPPKKSDRLTLGEVEFW